MLRTISKATRYYGLWHGDKVAYALVAGLMLAIYFTSPHA